MTYLKSFVKQTDITGTNSSIDLDIQTNEELNFFFPISIKILHTGKVKTQI